jgi:putative transposase
VELSLKFAGGWKKMELVSYSHSKGLYVYHLERKTKYGYKMFRELKYAKACEEILHKIVERHKMELLEVAILAEHLHVVVRAQSSISPAKAKQILKGGPSYELFKLEPKFRLRYPKGHFWSRGSFGRTISDVDLDTTRSYMREQASRYQQLPLCQFG